MTRFSDDFDDSPGSLDDFFDGLDRESILDEDEAIIGGLDPEDLALIQPPRRPAPKPVAPPVRRRRKAA